jgi:hypothetical protein
MHDGGGGHMGGGHMGGHMGGNVGGHSANPAHHHHHGSPGADPVGLGYLAGGDQARRNGMVAAAGQRFTSVFVLVGVAVIIAIVMLVS